MNRWAQWKIEILHIETYDVQNYISAEGYLTYKVTFAAEGYMIYKVTFSAEGYMIYKIASSTGDWNKLEQKTNAVYWYTS